MTIRYYKQVKNQAILDGIWNSADYELDLSQLQELSCNNNLPHYSAQQKLDILQQICPPRNQISQQ